MSFQGFNTRGNQYNCSGKTIAEDKAEAEQCICEML